MGDIGGRIEESKNWFERAASRIPGYRGYKEREWRREADKIQRLYVAERLEAGRRAIEDLELALTHRGTLDLLGVVDTTQRKLRTIKDRYAFADYGYAGWFDAVKVDEVILDGLYQLDVQAQDTALSIEQLAKSLSADSPSLRSDLQIMDDKIGALSDFFEEREHTISGAGR